MAFKAAFVTFAANTSTGTQDITSTALGGETATGAFFWYTGGVTLGTNKTNMAAFGTGAVSGSGEQWAASSVSKNSESSTTVDRRDMTDRCIHYTFPGGGIDGEAEFDSFITNGIRIDWTNAPDDPFLITVLLVAGVQTHAGTHDPGTTVDGTVANTDPGFEIGFMLGHTVSSTFSDARSDFNIFSFGIAINDGSETQKSFSYNEPNGQAAGDPHARMDSSYFIAPQVSGGTGLNWVAEITAFGATGFTTTLRNATAAGDEFGYFAVENSQLNVYLDIIDSPTSTGSVASSAPGFEPDAIMIAQSQLQSVDSGVQNSTAGAFSLGGAHSTSDEYTQTFSNEDGAGTTQTCAKAIEQIVHILDDDKTTGIDATLTSFDTNGYTLNYTNVKGTATKFIVFAFGSNDSFTVSGEVTPVGSLIKEVQKVFTGSITPSAVASLTRVTLQSLAGSITPSSTLSPIQVNKNAAGSVSPLGSVLETISKFFTGSTTPTGTSVLSKLSYSTVVGALSPIGALLAEPQIVRGGSIAPSSDPLSFVVSILRGGVITPTGTLEITSFTVAEEEPDTERYIYIEEVTYTEPYGLQITGGDEDRLKEFLSKRGIKDEADIVKTVKTGTVTKTTSTPGGGGTSIDDIYPPNDEEFGGLVPERGVIFWPPDAGEIPIGWQIYEAGKGKFLVGWDDIDFVLNVDGGQTTINLEHSHDGSSLSTSSEAHTHGPGTYTTTSESHTHGVGSYTTDSDSHTHGVGSYTTDSDSHTHGSGSLDTSSDSHNHGEGTLTTDSDSHSHDEGTLSTGVASGFTHADDNEDGITVEATTGGHSHSVTSGNTGSDSHSHGMAGGNTGSDSHDHTVNTGSTGSDSHSHGLNSGTSGSDSHSHGLNSGVSGSDSHSHTIDSGVSGSDSHSHTVTGTTGLSLSSAQSILPPYHVGTWIQFVGTGLVEP